MSRRPVSYSRAGWTCVKLYGVCTATVRTTSQRSITSINFQMMKQSNSSSKRELCLFGVNTVRSWPIRRMFGDDLVLWKYFVCSP